MAQNRIYIEVKIDQAGAVESTKQLNQAIADIGATTQKSSKQASQGLSSVALTLEQIQKQANVPFVGDTQASVRRVEAVRQVIAQLPDQMEEGARRAAELTAQFQGTAAAAAAGEQRLNSLLLVTDKYSISAKQGADNARILREGLLGVDHAAEEAAASLKVMTDAGKAAQTTITPDKAQRFIPDYVRSRQGDALLIGGQTSAEAARAAENVRNAQVLASEFQGTAAAIKVGEQRMHELVLITDKYAISAREGAENVRLLRESILNVDRAAEQRATSLRKGFEGTKEAIAAADERLKQFRVNLAAAAPPRAIDVFVKDIKPAVNTAAAEAQKLKAATEAAAASAQKLAKSLKDAGIGADSFGKNSRKAAQDATALKKSADDVSSSVLAVTGAITSMGLVQVGQDLIETAADFATLKARLESVEGSVNAMNSRFIQLRELARQPGLALRGTIKAFTDLREAGQGTRQSLETIEGFGRALGRVGGGSQELQGVMTQITQMLGKQKVLFEDIKIISSYLPRTLSLTREIWKTVDSEELKKMGVTAQSWIEAITQKFLQLKPVTGGIKKDLEMVKDEWELFKASLGEEIAPAALDVLREAQKEANTLLKDLKLLPDSFRDAAVVTGLYATALAGLASSIILVAAAWTKLNVAVTMSHPATLMILLGAAVVGGAVGAAWDQHKKNLEILDDLTEMAKRVDILDKLAKGKTIQQLVEQGYDEEGIKRALKGRTLGDEKFVSADITRGLNIRLLTKDEVAKKTQELTDEQKRAALDMRKHVEKMEEASADALRDSIIDRQKFRAQLLLQLERGDEYVAAQVQIILDEQKKKFQKEDVWVDSKGVKRQLEPTQQIIENRFRETLNRVGQARMEANLQQLQEIRDRETEAAQKIAEAWMESYQATNLARLQEADKGLQAIQDLERQSYRNAIEEQLSIERELIDHRYNMEIEALGALDDTTVQQKLALNAKRLEIEERYIDTVIEHQKKLLEFEKARAQAQLYSASITAAVLRGVRVEDLPEYQTAKEGLDKLYDQRTKQLDTSAQQQKEMARAKAVSGQYQIVRTEMQRTFEYFQNLAEGVFDALTTKSKSVWESLANFWKQAWLTAIKAVYSQLIAAGLMRMFGLPVPGGGGGGIAGGRGGLFGGFGGGSSGSPFGSGGWLSSIVGGPGGTGGFAGPMSFGGNPWGFGTPLPGATGGAASGGLRGALSSGIGPSLMYGGGPLATLSALGAIGMPATMATGNAAVNAAWTGALVKAGIIPAKAAGIGGAAGGALLLGGATLAGMGLYRGGLSGLAMTTAGGALIGTKFMPGIGTAVGAGIGFTAGLIRMLFKSAEDKAKKRIREVYGVSIESKDIIRQVVEIAKSQYGGDLNVALYSPQVRELVQLYGVSTAQQTGMGRPMYPVSYSMSGGQLSQQPVYSGANVVANPYTGVTTTQQSALYVQLNPRQAAQLFEGQVVNVLEKNPGVVGDTAIQGEATYRRTKQQHSLMEPQTLFS